jgi:hypothetical protein
MTTETTAPNKTNGKGLQGQALPRPAGEHRYATNEMI